VRKRFPKGETYQPGQRVEFRNGRHWHPAEVTGALDVDDVGYAYYPLRALQTRGTVTRGDFVSGYHGFVRPVPDAPGNSVQAAGGPARPPAPRRAGEADPGRGQQATLLPPTDPAPQPARRSPGPDRSRKER
jgi:hypothetical protein